VREPLGRLEVLLLQRSVQHAQSPYLAGRGRVVSLDVCFGLAVRGLEGERAGSLFFCVRNWLRKSSLPSLSYLLLVVQALVVVLKHGHAFRLAAVVLGVCVGDVACKDLLPEGEAARGAWPGVSAMYSDL
jgi:hypothetical protein